MAPPAHSLAPLRRPTNGQEDDPWALPADRASSRLELLLLEPYRRDLPHDEEYLFAKVSDAESQAAALWSRRQALEDAELEGQMTASTQPLRQEIAVVGHALEKTLKDAIDAIRLGVVHEDADHALVRLRLFLVAGRGELLSPRLRDIAWELHAKHLWLLQRRSVEPAYSFVSELSRLADHMMPLRGAVEEALANERIERAYEVADELLSAEAVFLQRFEAAVRQVRPADSVDAPELAESIHARIQLLMIGKIAGRRLRTASIEGALSTLEEKNTPSRTWPFAMPAATSDAQALATRCEANRASLPPAARSTSRMALVSRFWRPCLEVMEDPRSNAVIDAISDLFDRVEVKAAERPRVERLLSRWSANRVSSLDLREVQGMVEMDDSAARCLVRGSLSRATNPVQAARQSLYLRVLDLLCHRLRSMRSSFDRVGVIGLEEAPMPASYVLAHGRR